MASNQYFSQRALSPEKFVSAEIGATVEGGYLSFLGCFMRVIKGLLYKMSSYDYCSVFFWFCVVVHADGGLGEETSCKFAPGGGS